IYKTNVGDLGFRQLYVNGQRAIRARTPNKRNKYLTKSWDLVNKQVIINASEISTWARLNEVELVNLHQSQQANLRIASFSLSGNDAIVVPQEPERSEVVLQASLIVMWTIRTKTAVGGPNPNLGVNAYYFENAYEFLDSPGEWYRNPGTNELYYMPRAGEDMTTASVVAPVLEPTLVEIQGALDAPVHNLQFYGITFAHSNWTQPSRQGLVMVQAVEIFDNNSLSTMPPAISVRNDNNLRFERNIFEDLGATGLGLWSGTHDNVIIGNVFRDIAGTGLAIMQRQWNPVDYREVSQRDAVINNYFVRIGQDYRDSVGIFAGLPDSVHIEHNELFDMPYTGISIGWRWNASPTQ